MTTTLTIRLEDSLRKDLVRISREQGIPVSQLVRRSLSTLVALRRFEECRAASIPYARAAGYFTDEDVFKIKT